MSNLYHSRGTALATPRFTSTSGVGGKQTALLGMWAAWAEGDFSQTHCSWHQDTGLPWSWGQQVTNSSASITQCADPTEQFPFSLQVLWPHFPGEPPTTP